MRGPTNPLVQPVRLECRLLPLLPEHLFVHSTSLGASRNRPGCGGRGHPDGYVALTRGFCVTIPGRSGPTHCPRNAGCLPAPCSPLPSCTLWTYKLMFDQQLRSPPDSGDPHPAAVANKSYPFAHRALHPPLFLLQRRFTSCCSQ